MSKLEIVSVALPHEMAANLRRAVETGEFASQDAVVQSALQDWQDRRDSFGYQTEELRALVEDGIASGSGRYASMDEIKAEARRRWEADRLLARTRRGRLLADQADRFAPSPGRFDKSAIQTREPKTPSIRPGT